MCQLPGQLAVFAVTSPVLFEKDPQLFLEVWFLVVKGVFELLVLFFLNTVLFILQIILDVIFLVPFFIFTLINLVTSPFGLIPVEVFLGIGLVGLVIFVGPAVAELV